MESFLFKKGVIDLYESLGLYNKKEENEGRLISHYLEPIPERPYKLKMLDNLEVNV